MVDRFRDWDQNRHNYAKAWKEKTGGKVVGYFCTYVPEEILCAANILPVRILGGHEPQDVSEAHIFSSTEYRFSLNPFPIINLIR